MWLNKVDALSQAEIRLQVRADDLDAAAWYFRAHGIVSRDEAEVLPEDFEGFWIADDEVIHPACTRRNGALRTPTQDGTCTRSKHLRNSARHKEHD